MSFVTDLLRNCTATGQEAEAQNEENRGTPRAGWHPKSPPGEMGLEQDSPHPTDRGTITSSPQTRWPVCLCPKG